MIRILISCTAGITTNKLVEQMEELAGEKEIKCKIKAIANTQIEKEVDHYDVLLVGPDLLVSKAKEMVDNQIPVEAIDVYDYSSLNVASILDQAMHAYRAFY